MPAPEGGRRGLRTRYAASKDEEASHWTDALEKLHRVADVKLTAGVRYHLAFCEERLGQIATALAHYAEARDDAEREHNKDVLDLLKDPFLPNLRARAPTLSFEVPSDVSDAVVTIDSHPHPSGLWAVAMPVDPGAHHIEARAKGREPFTKDITVHERDVTVITITLPPTPTPTPTSTPTSTSPPPPTSPPTPTSPSTPSAHSPLPAALTAAGALVFIGGGVAAYLAAASAQTTGRTECLTLTNCDSLKTPVRTWDALALGAWIAGAALATTAIVLYSLPRPRTGQTSSAHVAIGPAGLQFAGSF